MRPPSASCFILFCFLPVSVSAVSVAADGFAIEDTTGTVAAGAAGEPSPDLPDLLLTAFSQSTDATASLSAGTFPFFGVRSPGELATLSSGGYLRDPISEGQYQQMNFRGADWRGIAFTVDGRLMNDPASGVFNPWHFPTDFIERMEVISGPRSFVYGLNAPGAAVNIVTKQFDTFRPVSRINYYEGPAGSGYFDGGISQNISDRVNATLGLQSRFTDGRYTNSASEAWNSRARIRYRLGERAALLLTHYHASSKTQLNGGLAPDSTSLANAFFPLATDVRNQDSYEKLTRNDFDLSFAGFFLDDSLSPTRLSLYYSHNFREYRDENGGTPPNDIFIQADHTSSWTGALLTQRVDQGFHRLSVSANIEIRQIEGSPTIGRRRNVIGSASVMEELLPGDLITLAGYGRYDRYLNKDYFGFGTDATLFPGGSFSLFGGISFSQRFPNYLELFWTDSTVARTGTLQQEEHTHSELGVRYSDTDRASVRVALFRRRVVHPVLFLPFGDFTFPGIQMTNGSDSEQYGIDFRFWFRVWHFFIEGNGVYLSRSDDTPGQGEFPEFSASGGIYFRERLIDDHLDLKAGFRGRFQTAQTGAVFNPEVIAYVANGDPAISAGGAVDLVIIGRIGDADIHFLWENLLDAEYFSTPYYPARERAIRFGISWTFLD